MSLQRREKDGDITSAGLSLLSSTDEKVPALKVQISALEAVQDPSPLVEEGKHKVLNVWYMVGVLEISLWT